MLIADNPADLVSLAGPQAEHVVLTYSHALDLEICHRVLAQPFGTLGLRFRAGIGFDGDTETHLDNLGSDVRGRRNTPFARVNLPRYTDPHALPPNGCPGSSPDFPDCLRSVRTTGLPLPGKRRTLSTIAHCLQ